MCFLKFSTKRINPFPDKKEIEQLTDIAYCNSDITPIPIIDVKLDDSNFSKYTDYIQKCYNVIEELNTKPIMGMIPRTTPVQQRKLIDFYLEKQVTAFCFDYNGRTPDQLMCRVVLRYLNSKKKLDKTLIYGINSKPGRMFKNSNVIPSKDFLAYGYGVDILGENHIGIKLPKQTMKNSKLPKNKKQINKKRIFMKLNYWYYKTDTKDQVADVYPNDTRVKLDDILGEKQRKLEKLFNMEQQSLEANKIKKRLESLDRNETILTYIEKKIHVKSEMKHLRSIQKYMSQQTLD